MDKKKLLQEVEKTLEEEKKDVVKKNIRRMVVDLKMAKRTVQKLETRLNDYLKSKDDDDLVFDYEY